MLKKTEPTRGRSNLRRETAYDKQIRVIRDEFNKLYIHEGLKPKDVIKNCNHAIVLQTAVNYIKRKTKRPTLHTLLAIADGIGLEVQFKRRDTKQLIVATLKSKGRGKVVPLHEAAMAA